MTIQQIKTLIEELSGGSNTRPIYLASDVLTPLVKSVRNVADDLRNNREIADCFRGLEEASQQREPHFVPHSSGAVLKLVNLAIASIPEPEPIVVQAIKPTKSDKTNPVAT